MEDCCRVDLPYPDHTFGSFQDNHSSIFGELPVQLGWVEVLKATHPTRVGRGPESDPSHCGLFRGLWWVAPVCRNGIRQPLPEKMR